MTLKRRRTFTQHYSGGRSRNFWRRVNTLPNKRDRDALYAAGVLLQDMEAKVLLWLTNAEHIRQPDEIPR